MRIKLVEQTFLAGAVRHHQYAGLALKVLKARGFAHCHSPIG